jgi:kynureninase
VFNTGQRIAELPAIVAAAHAAGGRLLLDVYHATGVIEGDVAALDADFAVGGSYKYLRGGPARASCTCTRAISTRACARSTSAGSPSASASPTSARSAGLAAGGDALLESTPPVITWYQARAGQRLALAHRAARVRAYSLEQQRRLVALLAERGIDARGRHRRSRAFVVVETAHAARWCAALAARGIVTDSRGPRLRLCPDVVTCDADLSRAAAALGEIARCTGGETVT